MDIYFIEASAAIENGHTSIIVYGKQDSSKCPVLGSSLLSVHGRE